MYTVHVQLNYARPYQAVNFYGRSCPVPSCAITSYGRSYSSMSPDLRTQGPPGKISRKCPKPEFLPLNMDKAGPSQADPSLSKPTRAGPQPISPLSSSDDGSQDDVDVNPKCGADASSGTDGTDDDDEEPATNKRQKSKEVCNCPCRVGAEKGKQFLILFVTMARHLIPWIVCLNCLTMIYGLWWDALAIT
jgi:hypothetical protein